MGGIQELLLNLLFILLPIFVYQTFWGDKETEMPKRNLIAIGFLAVSSTLLCMTFPVTLVPGFSLDLRLVPLLLGTLYGGWRVSLFVLLSLFSYRIFQGSLGIGFLLMMLYLPPIIAVAVASERRYFQLSRLGKTMFAMSLCMLMLIPTSLSILYRADVTAWQNPILPFLGFFSLSNLFAVLIGIYLIENIREKALMRLEAQRNEKLYVLGELAAAIAHEIRNPMTVVRGFLQLLQEQHISPEKQKKFMQLSIDELDRSELIISNYLAFAKPQIDKPERIDVGQRIHSVADIISSFAILRSVTVEHQSEHDLIIAGDPEKLSQALMNLFKNGIEAMTQGGTLQIHAHKRGHSVQIEVIDTGVGMSAAELTRLGNPYYSTKEMGTGLGLMVTYRLIHSMNGQVGVKSEKGKGTRFTLTFPLLDKNALPD
ncbi:ATP-binding protein [Tumebacillus lipolyticus]|uniref:histidine kinase n=1 Tax=Tumebacillus lipolyticus TaxID=1280370 RepID=A0ABW5A0S1_9BACL